jgi:iron-sulfur cluster repair protein YtfE (RIC family)
MSTTTRSWRDDLGPLRYLAVKVARVHGPTHPDMAILSEAIATLARSAEADHAGQAVLAQRIHELTHGFRPWDGACNSVRQLFAGLAAVVTHIPSVPGDHP